MYYPDLSPYEYSEGPRGLVNVGWLGSDRNGYAKGVVPRDVRDSLVRLAMEPVNVMRGLHHCELCDAESPVIVTVPDESGDAAAYLGSGEIHVSSTTQAYSAPTLVVHYIDAHDYLPPQEFLDAVRNHVD